jgi:hypothetical protein
MKCQSVSLDFQNAMVWNLTVRSDHLWYFVRIVALGGSRMPDQRLLALARDCRERAEEISLEAETFQDADAKQRMLEIAAQYQNLAKRLERAAADT